jgi:hypothetical protein
MTHIVGSMALVWYIYTIQNILYLHLHLLASVTFNLSSKKREFIILKHTNFSSQPLGFRVLNSPFFEEEKINIF